ncbi:MAG: succinate dehydrogenase, cytochrome b556 subunit [Sphingomonadales bacterium]|nr:succinate dehydrogenase, cytochrome b556 subunit [Sphingomonadales bacterium]PIX63933.1 MAG: succinate dehydrogenase, cytochrome b556 subunit [Sphingomonadales bacterium CG_4_10_14_3_um_filter_58_15]NCO48412.1 succinate dehydrogenase, cytochrome b556 subunit [Sphingomonadales bacterium]NCO99104.1 succinate dehydrogenase, cytochrome b556 subunit [Sphingomonadales bacterium]NCP26962.1 succinate dehydrogenase, cytochrome b556 subunit [Sphingomonadales bacterium]
MSPHLLIYRLTITMAMSIVHRLTGVVLYLGSLFFAWWIVAVSAGQKSYAVFDLFAASLPGKTIIFGFVWALIHHMLGGIRHLIWDGGLWINLPEARGIAWVTLIGSVTLALTAWIAGAFIRTLIQ